MKKVHIFNAGPCKLPQPAIEAGIEALKDFKGTGMSVIEISHRTKEWESIMDETVALWKELYNIPEGYHVLFLGGGASTQFCYVPFNLLIPRWRCQHPILLCSFQPSQQESRLSGYRRLGSQSHEGSQAVRRS